MPHTEEDKMTSPLFSPSLCTRSVDSNGPCAYLAVCGGSFISRYQSLVPGTSLGERSELSGSDVLARDVARDAGREVSRDCNRGGVPTTEVGRLMVDPARVEPATLEPPTLRVNLCFAKCSEIEDIIDGD